MKNTGGRRRDRPVWYLDVRCRDTIAFPPKRSGTLLAQLRVSFADVGGLKRDEQNLPFYDTVDRGAWHWLCD
jgi:hypothetical protein